MEFQNFTITKKLVRKFCRLAKMNICHEKRETDFYSEFLIYIFENSKFNVNIDFVL